MADNLVDCLARAASARAAAEAEPLENARARHLASAKVWDEMALKVRQTAEKRAAREEAAAETAAAEGAAVAVAESAAQP